jgi:hypothetical protein
MSELVKIVEIDGVEHLVIQHVEKQEIEFRVYYDDIGRILFYTCDKPEGNFIIVDKNTFAAARPDLRVVDGKLTTLIPGIIITKYKPNSTEGVLCASEDINIIVNNKHRKKQKWKLTNYELR